MPPNPLAMYVSSGQSFTQRGRAGRAGVFAGARDDIDALSARLLVVGRDAVVGLADALTFNTKEAIRRHMPASGRRDTIASGEPFEWSQGRLRAAWGIYTPEDMRGMVDPVGRVPIQEKHEEWAEENGVAGSGEEGGDIGEETNIEMGAVTEIKRVKGNIWSAEVGTYLPYAGLANDGGTMLVYPYGNRGATPVEAHWEGVHFIEEGVAATEAQTENIVEGSIQAALDEQSGRRTVKNPRPRRKRRG